MFSFLLDIYIGLEFLHHIITMYNILRNFFPKVTALFRIPACSVCRLCLHILTMLALVCLFD